MAIDYGAKKPVNFAESLLECCCHFKGTLLHVDMIALNMPKYSYEKIPQKTSLSSLQLSFSFMH